MKRIIQIILFFFLILLSFIFYKKYFIKKNITEYKIQKKNFSDKVIKNEKNSLIKNLKYEVKINSNQSYLIRSKLGEIVYVNNNELIKMYDVNAELIDQKKLPLKIISDEAIYNDINNKTNFYGNILISYKDNKIFCNKLEVNFKKNEIIMTENVRYIGLKGSIKSDVIKFDMLTKKLDIYMDKKDDNVELVGNR